MRCSAMVGIKSSAPSSSRASHGSTKLSFCGAVSRWLCAKPAASVPLRYPLCPNKQTSSSPVGMSEKCPITGSQPAGAGRWLAADRRIDFRASAAISAAFVARSRRLAFPKTSLGSILIARAGAWRRREGLMTDQTDLTTFHVRSNALR